ncbi:MAG: hypothetical protein ACRES4_09960, partial [Nevskiales bacterium]
VLWKQTTSTTAVTNSYTNSKGNADGLTALAQKSGAINAATITAAAKGLNAPDVTLPLTGPFVAEVQTTDGKCVSTTFATVVKNTNTELSVKLP